MRLRLRPSYSSVMSTLAVFIALSGGAYAAAKLPANSVGSRQIKSNAVTKAKIKSNSVDSRKVAPDALVGADIKEASLAKVPSAALADTATNATHANAAAAIDKLTYKTVAGSAIAESFGAASAACDPGQHLTGGGVRTDDAVAETAVDSFPDAANTSWTARVWNGTQGGPTLGFTVYAICATAVTIG